MWLDTGNFSSTLSLLRLEEIEDYLYKTDINSQHLEMAGGGRRWQPLNPLVLSLSLSAGQCGR